MKAIPSPKITVIEDGLDDVREQWGCRRGKSITERKVPDQGLLTETFEPKDCSCRLPCSGSDSLWWKIHWYPRESYLPWRWASATGQWGQSYKARTRKQDSPTSADPTPNYINVTDYTTSVHVNYYKRPSTFYHRVGCKSIAAASEVEMARN